jgi:hypothetical protein
MKTIYTIVSRTAFTTSNVVALYDKAAAEAMVKELKEANPGHQYSIDELTILDGDSQ